MDNEIIVSQQTPAMTIMDMPFYGSGPKAEAKTPEPAAANADSSTASSALAVTHTAAPVAAATPTIDDATLARAQQLGLSREESLAYGSPENLNRTIGIMERNYRMLLDGREQRQATPPQPAPAPPAPPPVDEWAIPFKAEDGYDPALIAFLDKTVAKIKSLEASQGKIEPVVQQVTQTIHQQSVDEQTRSIDRLFAAKEEYKDVLGEGDHKTIQANPTAFAARQKVADTMAIIQNVNQSRGITESPDVVLDKALVIAFGVREKKVANPTPGNGVAEKLRNQQGQFIAQPSHRNAMDNGQKNGRETSVENVTAILNRMRGKF